jgi:CRISPR/Cas system CMR subunit Cmr6 (Cas7 group RAMP superfamily)
MTNIEQAEFNKAVFSEKIGRIHREFNETLTDKLNEQSLSIGNARYTADELKLRAKKAFIIELSEQLTQLICLI